MKTAALNEMVKGWFIGNFDPSLFKTNAVEVAVKRYQKGDCEGAHYHRIATEYTVILNGRVRMFEREFSDGDIVAAEPGDITSFECLSDAVTVVVKIPGANDDKYVVSEEEN